MVMERTGEAEDANLRASTGKYIEAPHQPTFLKENKGWGGIPLKPKGL